MSEGFQFHGPFEPQPETLVGCGCPTVWHRIVCRLNLDTGRATETRICGQCGDARVLRAEIEVTDEMRAQLAAMAEEDADVGRDDDDFDDPDDMRRGDAWKR